MIVWSLTGLKNPQRSLWVCLHRYVIAEVGHHTLVSVKNNTREPRTVFSSVSLLWHQRSVFCVVSNLDVLFAQLACAHKWHSYPWIHSWFSHKHYVLLSYGYCQSIPHWTTGFWQVEAESLLLIMYSPTSLFSSWKHFGSPHLSPLMSDWRRWAIKTQIIKERYVALVS